MSNVFNIYCDESSVENVDLRYMVIGSLTIPRAEKKKITEDILSIYKDYSFHYELKWKNLHKKSEKFYKSLINYFAANDDLKFRCIIVDKQAVDLKFYHDNDAELAFFKFYYLMLRKKLFNDSRYYIFIDRKPTRDKNRARALHSFLDSHTLYNNYNCTIKHFQAYSSKDITLLQLTDLLTGLVAYKVNQDKKTGIKQIVADYLKEKLAITNFKKTSSLFEEKFNIFFWKGTTK